MNKKMEVNRDIEILNVWDLIKSEYPSISDEDRVYMASRMTGFTSERILEALERDNPRRKICKREDEIDLQDIEYFSEWR